jgi:transcriptional regulator with XRE-family HTH domain
MGTTKTKAEHTPVDHPVAVAAPMQHIAAEMEALRLRRGMSRRQLALAAGVHPTQMSQILLGQQGASIERTAEILCVLGAALLVQPGDEQRPRRIGTIDEEGRFMADTPVIVFPAYVECGPNTPEFAPGEQLFLKASEAFELGKIVLVELAGGRQVMRCVEESGLRFLRTLAGDDVRYVPERHRVVAVVYGSFRPM